MRQLKAFYTSTKGRMNFDAQAIVGGEFDFAGQGGWMQWEKVVSGFQSWHE